MGGMGPCGWCGWISGWDSNLCIQAKTMSLPCSDTEAAEGFCYGCTTEQWDSLTATLSDAAATTVCSAVQSIATAESDITGAIQGLAAGLNCLYLVLCAALVFIMHGGFAMVSQRVLHSAPDWPH
jgi:hypothetical protein